MKKLLPLLLTFVLAPILTSSTSKTDSDGHCLVKLWQEYAKAESADTPKTAAAALEKIKAEAARQHLVWDYYDACDKYVSVRSRSNWKLRDSLRNAFRAEIEAFGEPVALYYMRRGEDKEDLLKYVKDNEKRLRSGAHQEFWTRDWQLRRYKFFDALLPLLKNDWDYCLWSMQKENPLRKEYKSYPMQAFVEYHPFDQDGGRQEELKAYVSRWEGKAAALMAKEELLQYRFSALQQKGKSEDFKALRADCEALRKEAEVFKGDEKKIADCCRIAANLIGQMDSKNISASIEDSRLSLTLQNVDKVRILIYKDKEKVWEFLQGNPVPGYYVPDKLLTPLPDLPDGTYKVKCVDGELEEEVNWEKYSISAASRWNGDGLGIWAADFRTGKPLEKVDLEILKDSELHKTFRDIRLNGFTTVPKEAEKLLSSSYKNDWTIRLRSGKRASLAIYPGGYEKPDLSDYPNERHCIILTDRSAFQPDETVHFKAILYKGRYSLRTVDGEKLKVILRDACGDTVGEKTLTTNKFGSIAGEFVLQRRERNGNYSIEISGGGRHLGSRSILVDDFVLPTFDLVFDRMPDLYLPLESVTVKGSVKAYSGHSLAGADISYCVKHDGRDWAEGKIVPDKDRFSFSFPADSTDAAAYGSSYSVTVKVTDVTGETMEFQKWIHVGRHYQVETPKTEFFFEDLEDAVGCRIVAGKAETWAVAELYGTGNILLDKRLLHFSPKGDSPAETTVSWNYSDKWPENVRLNILYFQDKKSWVHSLSRERRNQSCDMPLSFERFLDTTAPGARYSFTIKTLAGAEVAASVFDKSTERFRSNNWYRVDGRNRPGPDIYFNATSGKDSGDYPHIFYKTRGAGMVLMSKASANATMDAVAMDEEAVVESARAQGSGEGGDDGIMIREDFATTIAWEPFLKADENGSVKFTFTNADKLSTYYVQLFSHDAAMHNAVVRKEMTVTIPVKISLVEPRFLYEGDVWTVRTGLSSSLAGDISGTLLISFIDGSDWRNGRVIASQEQRITVPGRSSCNSDIRFTVPEDLKDLGIKLTFSPDRVTEGADGVFVAVPVRKASQTLTESHSAVLLAGKDRTALERELRGAFVNIPGSEAALRDISILDMVKEALPEAIEADGENAIALSSALYAESLCRKLGVSPSFDRAAAVSKLLALKGEDGGFAWMKGMSSSPIVTAVVLQRLRGLGIIDETAAVHFLDEKYFKRDKDRWWYCGLSMSQYLYTRSLFPSVKFEEKTTKEFRKEARSYLVPGRERGLVGQVFAKSRRLLTLDNFASSKEGLALARKMGIRLMTAKKINKSVAADVASLVEYAEGHRHGGIYYPNAVMPWRGLLESELYAHGMICNLMAAHSHGDIADGIRLWMMLQKETQHWEDDPGFIEAIAAVMDASPEVLATRVLALSGTYDKPFPEILAAGNGMSISQATSPDSLRIGDRIRISWNLYSEENRSFVKVTLPHNAGLVPVNQTSGYRRGCYRSVLSDRTELWYESYPEEKISVSEEYYVTRAGEFQCPAAQIECLYADHYRANTAAPEIRIIKE